MSKQSILRTSSALIIRSILKNLKAATVILQEKSIPLTQSSIQIASKFLITSTFPLPLL